MKVCAPVTDIPRRFKIEDNKDPNKSEEIESFIFYHISGKHFGRSCFHHFVDRSRLYKG